MIELLKVLFVLFVGLLTLPVLLFLMLCCAVYELLVALWWGWRWLKESK
jgi:hypothetical protein